MVWTQERVFCEQSFVYIETKRNILKLLFSWNPCLTNLTVFWKCLDRKIISGIYNFLLLCFLTFNNSKFIAISIISCFFSFKSSSSLLSTKGIDIVRSFSSFDKSAILHNWTFQLRVPTMSIKDPRCVWNSFSTFFVHSKDHV